MLAKYITALANSKHVSINITKIQKLLYIAYGIYLAVKGHRLTDEHPQAWPYGPVFPTTRNKLIKLDFNAINKDDPEFSGYRSDKDLNSLLNLVFQTFGSWTAGQLSQWSHSPSSPWEIATCEEGFKWGDTIPDQSIEEYFKSLIYVKDRRI